MKDKTVQKVANATVERLQQPGAMPEFDIDLALSTAQKIGFGVLVGAMGVLVVSSLYGDYMIKRWLREDIDRSAAARAAGQELRDN